VTVETPGQYDAKIPIGSLMVMFGMNRTPYLKPDEELVESYRKELKKLGPGPYIAVTWHGGSKQTRVVDRTMRPQCLESLEALHLGFCPVLGFRAGGQESIR
jgi:predicted nicotinamide N-methyase